MARSYTSTTRGDLTTTIASKIVDLMMAAGAGGAAKKAAAASAAAKYGVELESMPGEFFAKELLNEIIETIIGRKARQFILPDEDPRDVIMRGQAVEDPLIGVPAHLRNLPEYQNIASPEEKMFKSRQAVAGSKPKEGSSNKPVKVKDPKLGVFLTQVADALNKSVSSLNTKLDNTETVIIASEKGIGLIAKQLEQNSDILESKLDAIVDVLNQQVNLAKLKEDQSEIREKVSTQNLENNESGAFRFTPVGGTDEETAKINREENDDEIGATDAQRTEYRQQDAYRPQEPPTAEQGAIFSGPDSGYTVELHGDEMVVPMDNNYTQGEPSAVDGKIRTPPQYEIGTPMIPKKTSFTPEVFAKSVVPQVVPVDLKEESEKLKEAVQVPVKAAGIITMGSLSRSLNDMGPLAADVGKELKLVGDSYSGSFGVPNSVVGSMVRKGELAQRNQLKDLNFSLPNQGGEGPKKKFNWLNPLTWFGGGGNRNYGGGSREYIRGGSGGGVRGQLARMLTPSWLPGSNTIRNRLLRGSLNPFGQRPVSSGAAGRVRVPVYHGRSGYGTMVNNPGREFYASPDMRTGGRFAQSNQLTKGSSPVPRGGTNYRTTLPQRYIDKYGSRSMQGFRQIKMSQTAANRAFSSVTGNPTRFLRPNMNMIGSRLGGLTRGLASFGAKANPYTLAAEIIIGDITKGHNLTEEEWMNGPGTLGYMERMMAERNQGGGQTIQPAVGPPQRIRPAQVEAASQNAFFNKMNAQVQNLEPIYLNNTQGGAVSDDQPISPIGSQGNSQLEMYYPSLNQF